MQFNTHIFLAATFSLASVTQSCVLFSAITSGSELGPVTLQDNGNDVCWYNGSPQLECDPTYSSYVDIPNAYVTYQNPWLDNGFPITNNGPDNGPNGDGSNLWTGSAWCD